MYLRFADFIYYLDNNNDSDTFFTSYEWEIFLIKFYKI